MARSRNAIDGSKRTVHVRRFPVSIPDEFDGRNRGRPANIADEFIFLLQVPQAVEDFAADLGGVVQQALFEIVLRARPLQRR